MFVLFSCDIWKTFDSMRLFGVFTSRRALRKAIMELLHRGDVELVAEGGMPDFSDVQKLNDNFTYLYINEVSPNKLL